MHRNSLDLHWGQNYLFFFHSANFNLINFGSFWQGPTYNRTGPNMDLTLHSEQIRIWPTSWEWLNREICLLSLVSTWENMCKREKSAAWGFATERGRVRENTALWYACNARGELSMKACSLPWGVIQLWGQSLYGVAVLSTSFLSCSVCLSKHNARHGSWAIHFSFGSKDKWRYFDFEVAICFSAFTVTLSGLSEADIWDLGMVYRNLPPPPMCLPACTQTYCFLRACVLVVKLLDRWDFLSFSHFLWICSSRTPLVQPSQQRKGERFLAILSVICFSLTIALWTEFVVDPCWTPAPSIPWA